MIACGKPWSVAAASVYVEIVRVRRIAASVSVVGTTRNARRAITAGVGMAIVADGVVITGIGGTVITRDIAATLRVIAMTVVTTGEAVAAAGVIDKK